jgi:hypothetical protein
MRHPMRILLMVLCLAGLGSLAWSPFAGAQETTPAWATPSAADEGVTFEPIAGDVAAILPPAPATIWLFRLHLAPGTTFSDPDGDPDTGVILVESGTLRMRVTRSTSLTRGDGTSETM